MIKIDRLRFLSVGVLVVAFIALAMQVFGGSKHDPSLSFFTNVMIFLGTALEQIRLELRDLRKELSKQDQ
jgi:hypothetical protein